MPGRRNVFTDIVRTNRQFPVAAVDEYGKLNRLRTAMRKNRLDRGAGRAAGVQDVIDQNNFLLTENGISQAFVRGSSCIRVRSSRYREISIEPHGKYTPSNF